MKGSTVCKTEDEKVVKQDWNLVGRWRGKAEMRSGAMADWTGKQNSQHESDSRFSQNSQHESDSRFSQNSQHESDSRFSQNSQHESDSSKYGKGLSVAVK
ncbi:hypothetical protein KM043_007522 [Ampulex compressa]|nr:hypothetical protein KM043_007522 [Ampulex compressa]